MQLRPSPAVREQTLATKSRPGLQQRQAITLGRYYLYEQQFASADIQAVLEDLRDEDPELYNHALFGGQLIVYSSTRG